MRRMAPGVTTVTHRRFVLTERAGRLSGMSDQTPPSSEPTPHPEDGAAGAAEAQPAPAAATPGETPAQTHDDATTTAPVPPVAAYGEAPPAAPAKSRKGLLIGIIAAVLVVILVAGGAVALVLSKGSDKHTITTPTTAGQMKRDSTKEKALATQLTQAEQQFKTQATGVAYVKSAVYNQTDAKRGPAGGLVFLGAKLSKLVAKNPTTFVASFTKQAKANGLTVTNTAAGSNGGKAVCASVTTPQKVAICAWATQDTVGELVPTVPGYDSAALSNIMRSLRTDVEKSD